MHRISLTFIVVALLLSQPALAEGSDKLPQTRLDSFVFAAGGNADLIYGDEGGRAVGERSDSSSALPPYFSYDRPHRIASGGESDALSTGHGSYLPDATGKDEFLGAEWSQSAPYANISAAPPVMAPPVTGAVQNGVSASDGPLPSSDWDLSILSQY